MHPRGGGGRPTPGDAGRGRGSGVAPRGGSGEERCQRQGFAVKDRSFYRCDRAVAPAHRAESWPRRKVQQMATPTKKPQPKPGQSSIKPPSSVLNQASVHGLVVVVSNELAPIVEAFNRSTMLHRGQPRRANEFEAGHHHHGFVRVDDFEGAGRECQGESSEGSECFQQGCFVQYRCILARARPVVKRR